MATVGSAGRLAAAVQAALPRSRFTPLVGQRLTVSGPSGTVRARLEEVRDLAGCPASDERSFALELRCPRGSAVTNGIHTVSHPQLESVSLYLGPVERGTNGPLLEAVVNQV